MVLESTSITAEKASEDQYEYFSDTANVNEWQKTKYTNDDDEGFGLFD